ncbi:DNA cytosine methyltransferase [Reichenbachiella agariperforans]|uniref:DNA cytosine methyltransferase n=1 Tax=Reichenbachiella agariperforans TaxID=156994 RepID=UPI001C0895E5|nr:DNA cytosine methyltransferase [Reichenbachiella agariperforans]MBU2914846.1 DNA cytosine methyltransferase [Reichenbachiella agariperforans]
MSNKNTYIDLFAGCGGLSLGLFNSGFWKGKFAVEKSPDAFETLNHNLIEQHNHFDWPEWFPKANHDINEVIKNYSQKLKSLRSEIDMVAGGPPCQGFSTAGRRDEKDTRNKLIISYIKFIRLVQPKIIFFENVKGFTQQFDKNKIRGRIYSDYVQKELRKSSKTQDFIGYEVFGKLIDFSEYGVPQKRTRFILVGVRKDVANSKAPEQFFEQIIKNKEAFLVNKGIGITNTLEDAISDLLRVNETTSPDTNSFKAGLYNQQTSNYQKLLKGNYKSEIPDSHRFAKHSKATHEKLSYILKYADKNKTLSKELKEKFNLKKRTVIPLSGKLPTPTITTLPDDYVHYCEPRIFTVREYARIQSFNDWYEFKGKYTTGGKERTKEVPRYSQIGNAIPPLFGEQAGLVLKTFTEAYV